MSSFVSETLARLLSETGVAFSAGGINIDNTEAFAEDGALPLFAVYADTLATAAMGENNPIHVGVKLDSNESGLYGAVVELDSAVPESVQILLIQNAVIEYANSQIPDQEIRSYDDLKRYADAKRPADAEPGYMAVLPLDALVGIVSAKIHPDETISALLNPRRG